MEPTFTYRSLIYLTTSYSSCTTLSIPTPVLLSHAARDDWMKTLACDLYGLIAEDRPHGKEA